MLLPFLSYRFDEGTPEAPVIASLKVAYPSVPYTSISYTSSQAHDEDYFIENLFSGERHNFAKITSDQSTLQISWDLGEGNATDIDHLIIGDARGLIDQGVTGCVLQGSSNNSTWVSQLGTGGNFLTRTLTGVYGRDLVFTPGVNDEFAATLGSYRYWRITFSGGYHRFAFSKLYFGKFFNFGREPATYDIEAPVDEEDTYRLPRGQVIMSRVAFPKHLVTIEYDGLSDAKVQELFGTILQNPFKNTLWLYASTYNDPLYGNTLIYCKPVLDQCSSSPKRGKGGYSNVKLVFEELI